MLDQAVIFNALFIFLLSILVISILVAGVAGGVYFYSIT